MLAAVENLEGQKLMKLSSIIMDQNNVVKGLRLSFIRAFVKLLVCMPEDCCPKVAQTRANVSQQHTQPKTGTKGTLVTQETDQGF